MQLGVGHAVGPTKGRKAGSVPVPAFVQCGGQAPGDLSVPRDGWRLPAATEVVGRVVRHCGQESRDPNDHAPRSAAHLCLAGCVGWGECCNSYGSRSLEGLLQDLVQGSTLKPRASTDWSEDFSWNAAPNHPPEDFGRGRHPPSGPETTGCRGPYIGPHRQLIEQERGHRHRSGRAALPHGPRRAERRWRAPTTARAETRHHAPAGRRPHPIGYRCMPRSTPTARWPPAASANRSTSSAMAKLWDKPFTAKPDELAALAGPKVNAQRLGQISRQLKEELLSTVQGKAISDGHRQRAGRVPLAARGRAGHPSAIPGTPTVPRQKLPPVIGRRRQACRLPTRKGRLFGRRWRRSVTTKLRAMQRFTWWATVNRTAARQ